MKPMDEFEVVLKRFGDDQSTLLDQFERLSFEVQLNQAILSRSLSEPGGLLGRPRFKLPLNGEVPAALVKTQPVKQRRGRRRGFSKVFKKLKHMFGRNGATVTKGSKANDDDDGAVVRREVPDPRNPRSWKAFSRSLRF